MLLAKLVLFRKDYKFAQKCLSLSVGQHRSVSFCGLFDLAGNSNKVKRAIVRLYIPTKVIL